MRDLCRLLLCCCISCSLQGCRGCWSGVGVAWPYKHRDGWRKDCANGRCRENKGSPRKTCRERERERGKAQGSPAAAGVHRRRIPTVLLLLHSLHAAARPSEPSPSEQLQPDFRLHQLFYSYLRLTTQSGINENTLSSAALTY